jgi:hypothetical protein
MWANAEQIQNKFSILSFYHGFLINFISNVLQLIPFQGAFTHTKKIQRFNTSKQFLI